MIPRNFISLLTLTVGLLGGCSSSPVIDPARLIDPPVAAFEMTPEYATTGEWVAFEAQVGALGHSRAVRFLWEFGDGNSAEGQTARHRYRQAGSFTVTLTTHNVQDMQARTERIIDITPPVVQTPAFPYTFGAGVRGVGDEIEPGLYRTRSGGRDCYWERLLGLDGAINQVIAQHNNDGPVIAEIFSGDRAFNSQGCARWTKDISQITSDILAPFGDGVYFVGDDIAPGLWRAEDFNRCHWQRLSGFSWEEADVIEDGLEREAPATVHIQSGDTGFASMDCGAWTRVEDQ